jgi:hypothetical protein
MSQPRNNLGGAQQNGTTPQSAGAVSVEEQKLPVKEETKQQPSTSSKRSPRKAAAVAPVAAPPRPASPISIPSSPSPADPPVSSSKPENVARNSMSIALEEWSEDDLQIIGDGRGEDAKFKAYAKQETAEEIVDILQVREIQPPPTPSTSAAAPSSGSLLSALTDRFEYLIRWRPSSLRQMSWEPASALKGAQAKLQAFLEQKKKNGWKLPPPSQAAGAATKQEQGEEKENEDQRQTRAKKQ